MNKIIPNSQSLVPATAVSLFSGCGGFDWGVKQSGIEIIWANDIDPHAAHAYKGLFPDVKFTLGDVREVTTFPEADILIGCYPCTGFWVFRCIPATDSEVIRPPVPSVTGR